MLGLSLDPLLVRDSLALYVLPYNIQLLLVGETIVGGWINYTTHKPDKW